MSSKLHTKSQQQEHQHDDVQNSSDSETQGFTSTSTELSLCDLPYEMWELLGTYMSQIPLDSLLAFRQTCTTARKLVDSLPNFCKDMWINFSPNNFHRFMIKSKTTLPLHNFRLSNVTHLSKFQSFFPAFTLAWAERITTLHIRTIHFDLNFPLAAFLSSLTKIRHLQIDKIERYDKNTLTNLPLSLFAKLHTLNIRTWDANCHFIDMENTATHSCSAVGDKLSLKFRNYTPSEFCSQLFKTLKENAILSHLSLNLRNIPIEYVTSLIRNKRDTRMTFQLLCDEEVRRLLDESFIVEVSASYDKVQMVDAKSPAGSQCVSV